MCLFKVKKITVLKMDFKIENNGFKKERQGYKILRFLILHELSYPDFPPNQMQVIYAGRIDYHANIGNLE